MAEGRFYWLKLKRDFFKRHDIRIIESMPNGKDYILFYLKLLCESVDHEGNLRFSEQIPYNAEMLATITNTNVDIVRSAIKVFTELNMMEILDDGTFYMSEVEKLIGSAANNDNANRQRRFREKQKELALANRYDGVTKNNESKSIELDIEKDIDVDVINSGDSFMAPPVPLKPVQMTDIDQIIEAWNKQNCTRNIRQIPFASSRYNNTMICANNDLAGYLLTIGELDKQAWLMERAKEEPLTYDWFCNPTNYQKVVEGNYRELRQRRSKATETDFNNFSQRQNDWKALEAELLKR